MRTILDWVKGRVHPERAPEPDLGRPPRSMSEVLPYETVLELGGRPVVLLDGGSLGIVWELEPVQHEMLTDDRLREWAGTLAGIVQNIHDDSMVFQLILDSRPGTQFQVPTWRGAPTSLAQEIVCERIDAVAGEWAQLDAPAVRTASRRLFLTARIEAGRRRRRWSLLPEKVEAALDREAEGVARLERRLIEHVQVIEEGLRAKGWDFRRCDGEALLWLLRGMWHDGAALEEGAATLPYNAEERIRDQVVRGRVRMAPSGVQVGDDTWEVVSWLEQPPVVHQGMFSVFLGLAVPFRMVVNLRPCLSVADLALSAQVLKPATDERGVRHREELQAVERARAYGQQLMSVSVHLFARSEGVPLGELRERGIGRALSNQLGVVAGVPFFHEETFASGLALLCQPLGYTASSGHRTSRERRVLSGALGPYLPIFGGYAGTTGSAMKPVKNPTQLMVSRAGDPVWLSCRDSDTAPHLAVLASTGAGKSFFMSNLMTSELAANPDSLIFIIDSITSYRVFGEVMGEEDGFLFARPPQSFPNIFLGELDADRVRVIVGILCTAITLEDPKAPLTSEHRQLLEVALRKAYEDVQIEAGTSFEEDGGFADSGSTRRAVPRLSNVVDNLVPCAAEGNRVVTAEWLRRKLSAYYGEGAYAQFFDQEAMQEGDEQTPRVMLFDLERVNTDPVLSTLTMVCCIAEILRHLRMPENIGRKGMLVIEEAGVLGSSSKELTRFIAEAWKTFRKLGIICAGLTNEVDDYRLKAAPQTMWSNSPNKVILRLLDTELDKAGLADETRGIPRLLKDDHVREVAGSLRIAKGVYSHGMWLSEKGDGTFLYQPTGHDYWLAASKPIEVAAFMAAAEHFGSKRRALQWLARTHPMGIRDATGELMAFDPSLVVEEGR